MKCIKKLVALTLAAVLAGYLYLWLVWRWLCSPLAAVHRQSR